MHSINITNTIYFKQTFYVTMFRPRGRTVCADALVRPRHVGADVDVARMQWRVYADMVFITNTVTCPWIVKTCLRINLRPRGKCRCGWSSGRSGRTDGNFHPKSSVMTTEVQCRDIVRPLLRAKMARTRIAEMKSAGQFVKKSLLMTKTVKVHLRR